MSPTAAKALPVERIGPAAKIASHAAAPSGDVNVLSLLVPISEASLTTPSTSVVESDTARTSSPGLASEPAPRKSPTRLARFWNLTCPTPVGPDAGSPVAVLSPPDGRDARRERVSGVYAGRRSC